MTDELWDRAHEVFRVLLEHPEAEREVTLGTLSESEPEVAATVRALLAGHSMDDGPFDRLHDRVTGGLPEEAAPPTAEESAPPTAEESMMSVAAWPPRWRWIRELGRGGMGVVHLARDTTLSRDVAIKTLSQDVVASPRARRRLLEEARTVAALDHPNIVPIHEAGVDESSSLYLVFGYSPGETLKDRLRDHGPFPDDEALEVLLGVARGLQAAHVAGVVHRDVKPSNILIGDDGTVRLTDFGIARRPTAPGVVGGRSFGTPAYMPPEALSGVPPDPRSDVWALGVVLHEMLTGRRPAAAGEATVPARFEPVLAGMLRVDPEDRFADAGAVVEALEGLERAVPEAAPVAGGGWLRRALWAGGAVATGWGVFALVADSPTRPPVVPSVEGGGAHVLWVDDDPGLSADEESSLRAAGYAVTRARSTEEGLAVFDPAIHDVVVSDLGRVEAGGYREDAGLDLLRRLRARTPDVAVIFFTSERAAAVIREAPDLGDASVTVSSEDFYRRVGERAGTGADVGGGS